MARLAGRLGVLHHLPLSEVLGRVVQEVRADTDDDTTVLAVRFHPEDLPRNPADLRAAPGPGQGALSSVTQPVGHELVESENALLDAVPVELLGAHLPDVIRRITDQDRFSARRIKRMAL